MKHRLCRPNGIWIDWKTGWSNPEIRVDFEDDTHFAVEIIGKTDKEALPIALMRLAELIANYEKTDNKIVEHEQATECPFCGSDQITNNICSECGGKIYMPPVG